MIPSDLWWNYVPAGTSIRDNISQQIIRGRCVILDTLHLPWIDALMESVQQQVISTDAELNWNVIDATQTVGYRPIEVLGSYFGADQVPVEKMIQQRIQQLPSCCWVRNISKGDSEAWLQLARDLFSGKEQFRFRLVLELCSIPSRSIGKIAVIDTRIERFDIYYFALSILATSKLSKTFQEYASTLCAELADGNVYLCYELCMNIDSVLNDPLTSCQVVRDESQQKQLVCRAQTRSISPLIDIGRLRLISIFGKRVELILPQTDDYGNTIHDVSEVELRHLIHFSNYNLLPISHAEREMLHCLYNARNDISHLHLLAYSEIQKLFSVLDILS